MSGNANSHSYLISEQNKGIILTKSTKSIIFGILAFYLVVTQVLPRIFALTYEAKNATVVLKGCESEDCYLKGTLTRNPFNLDNTLTTENGDEIVFSYDNIVMIIIPNDKPID